MSADPNSSDYQTDESAGGDAAGQDGSLDFNQAQNTDFVVTEPKKKLNTTTAVLFVVVALGGGALYLMHLRAGPSSAAAAANPAANATVEQFLNGGQTNIVQMERMLKETQKVVDQFLAYPSVTQIPLTALQTNPFRQLLGGDSSAAASAAELARKKEEEKAAMLKALQGLQLQSVISMGAKSTCMVNNAMYREGQKVEDFTIEKITSNSVIVRNGTYRFELKMQR